MNKVNMLNPIVLARHIFTLNEEDNGGEQVHIVTEIVANGDKAIIETTEMEMISYSNSASFMLGSAQFTPERLRRFADELELELEKAQILLAKSCK